VKLQQLAVAGLTIVIAGSVAAAISMRGENLHRDRAINETVATTVSTPMTVTKVSTPATIPNYVAVDYNTTGLHPPLTRAEAAAIRNVLARVKPCQRSLVRYVLAENEKDGIALFFEPEPNRWAHILGEPDAYYTPMNGVFAGPPDDPDIQAQEKQGMQWDIDRQPCSQL
jgi:hypothetical protein